MFKRSIERLNKHLWSKNKAKIKSKQCEKVKEISGKVLLNYNVSRILRILEFCTITHVVFFIPKMSKQRPIWKLHVKFGMKLNEVIPMSLNNCCEWQTHWWVQKLLNVDVTGCSGIFFTPFHACFLCQKSW